MAVRIIEPRADLCSCVVLNLLHWTFLLASEQLHQQVTTIQLSDACLLLMQTKSFTSLSKLRNATTKNACLKEGYKEVMSVPIEILKERFSRLKWKGVSVVVHDVAQEDMMVDLYNIFLLIDVEVKPEHVSNLRTLKSEKIDAFIAKHAQSRHFSYQVSYFIQVVCVY